MDNSIYSLVLSDSVVEAVDEMAAALGLSRSAMINRILAEKVSLTTPEMRLKEILSALQRSMGIGFLLSGAPSGGKLSCRTTLRYRYNPTVRYSVEIFSARGESRVGELRAAFRTQSAQLIDDLTGFFRCWAEVEAQAAGTQDVVYTIEDGRFMRTLCAPSEPVSEEEIGKALGKYLTMFDYAMKEYFGALPNTEAAARAVRAAYAAFAGEMRFLL